MGCCHLLDTPDGVLSSPGHTWWGVVITWSHLMGCCHHLDTPDGCRHLLVKPDGVLSSPGHTWWGVGRSCHVMCLISNWQHLAIYWISQHSGFAILSRHYSFCICCFVMSLTDRHYPRVKKSLFSPVGFKVVAIFRQIETQDDPVCLECFLQFYQVLPFLTCFLCASKVFQLSVHRHHQQ